MIYIEYIPADHTCSLKLENPALPRADWKLFSLVFFVHYISNKQSCQLDKARFQQHTLWLSRNIKIFQICRCHSSIPAYSFTTLCEILKHFTNLECFLKCLFQEVEFFQLSGECMVENKVFNNYTLSQMRFYLIPIKFFVFILGFFLINNALFVSHRI